MSDLPYLGGLGELSAECGADTVVSDRGLASVSFWLVLTVSLSEGCAATFRILSKEMLTTIILVLY